MICRAAGRISQVGTPLDRSQAQQRFFFPGTKAPRAALQVPFLSTPNFSQHQNTFQQNGLHRFLLRRLRRRPQGDQGPGALLTCLLPPVHPLPHALARAFSLSPVARYGFFFFQPSIPSIRGRNEEKIKTNAEERGAPRARLSRFFYRDTSIPTRIACVCIAYALAGAACRFPRWAILFSFGFSLFSDPRGNGIFQPNFPAGAKYRVKEQKQQQPPPETRN